MDANADDPFDSLTQLCLVSDSQENVLCRCPFAGGREHLDLSDDVDSKSFRPKPTDIFLPDSLEQGEPSIPREAPPPPVKSAVDDPCLKAAVAVPVVGSGCMGDDEAVDLGLGLHSEVQATDEIQIIAVRKTGVVGSQAKRKGSRDELCLKGESSSKRLKLPVVDLTESDDETSSSAGETHCNHEEKYAGKKVREESVAKSQADEPTEFEEKTNSDESRRMLPCSVSEEEKENRDKKKCEETEATSGCDNSGKAKATTTLLEILKILKEEEIVEEDEKLAKMSLLDVVMKSGMTFPRPCWWPENGFK